MMVVHLCEKPGLLYCMSQLGGWVGGWVGVRPPPGGGGGVGHLSVCGYAKILGGWVPELTPPPRVAKQNPDPHSSVFGDICALYPLLRGGSGPKIFATRPSRNFSKKNHPPPLFL